MTGPLHGFRIIDVTSMVSGPSATMLLADQGADVIKVENPGGGDHTRASANTQNGFSANFLNNNRNKRSVTLNLKDQGARQALLKLCEGADVFIQNFRPGVVDRMGIGEADIRAVCPDIVYVSISGFGETGPYAGKPVYDPLIQALSILPDKLTGIVAAQAITAALLSRTRTGEGQHIRLSMLDTIIAFLWGSDMGSQTFIDSPFPQQNAASFIDLIYETADGHISVAVQSNKEWAGLSRAFDMPELLDDSRFTTPALRQQNIDARLTLTQDVLRTRPADEWIARLEAEDVPCAPVLTRTEAISHPQVVANEIVVETLHHLAGGVRQARPAARFSATPTEHRSGGPALGEHTAEVLGEIGYTADQIDGLTGANKDAAE